MSRARLARRASAAHPFASSSTETDMKPDLLLSLPDVPTLAIVSLLPLQQVIVNLPLVHRRLAPIRENVLTGTQRLAIYISDQKEIKQVKIGSRIARQLVDSTGEPLCPEMGWSELNQLRLATLDSQAVEQLSSLMPGIVHLQVVIADAQIAVLPTLAILLAQWAPTLQTLQLNIGKLYFIERLGLIGLPLSILTSNLRLLLQTINPKFVALQHLTLDIGKLIDDAQFVYSAKFVDDFLFGAKTGVHLSLPILGQLKEFYLDLGKGANGQTFLLDALKKYATEKLTNISLNGVPFENVNDLANCSPSPKTGPQPDLLLSLPDVPTLAILSLLPLQQLIVNLPLVHPRLAPIRQSVLKGTQRLVLHIGDQKEIKELQFYSSLRLPFASHLVDSTGALLYPEKDFYTLHLATLDDHSVKQLSSLMPAIVHLQVLISHARISVLPQLTILLSQWAPTLQSLELNIGDLHSNGVTWKKAKSSTILSNFRLFIQKINCKLGALQTLTLDIRWALNDNSDEFLFGGQTGVPLRLSILGQLKESNLDLGSGDQTFFLDQLNKYATEKLTTIGLAGNHNWNWTEMANSQFAARFTRVPGNHYPTSNPTLLLPSFPNLTVYAFDWKKLSAFDLVAHLRVLSSLPQLQCLKVYPFSPVSHPLPASSTDLPSLRSVTVLDISIDLEVNGHHNYLQAPYWWTLFPSVQIVKVTHGGQFCAICYPGSGRNARLKKLNYAQVTPCLRQLFAPLRGLPSLRKIFHQRYGQSAIAEFTPQGDFVRTHEYIG